MTYILCNESSRVSGHELDVIAKAVNLQLSEASFKYGRLPKTLHVVEDSKHLAKQLPAMTAFCIRDVMDDGEHGRTEKNGMQVIYVFAEHAPKVISDIDSIASRVSKQVLGYFGNPTFSSWCLHPEKTSFIPHELCLPVEDVTYDVVVSDIDGVARLVSVCDYVYPSWFSPKGAAPFDRAKKLEKPFACSKGGFLASVDFKEENYSDEGPVYAEDYRVCSYNKFAT